MTKDQVLTTLGDVLTAYAGLSEEDREEVKAKIAGETKQPCGGDEMQAHMKKMMQMMGSSEDPKGMCSQMMSHCKEMMSQLESGTESKESCCQPGEASAKN